jgi:DNA-binding NtrC family response regulator
MNKHHDITHLIHIDPKAAGKRILAALKEEGMHKGNAAKRIGCAHSTLLVWIKQLELIEEIEKMTQTAVTKGWHHGNVGGRPQSEETRLIQNMRSEFKDLVDSKPDLASKRIMAALKVADMRTTEAAKTFGVPRTMLSEAIESLGLSKTVDAAKKEIEAKKAAARRSTRASPKKRKAKARAKA